VPITMLMGMVGGVLNGRYVCGNLCPRGAFYDRYFESVGPKRPIPQWMRSYAFRWSFFVLLMTFMVLNVLRAPDDWRHWGFVFWLMCAVTTALGLVLVLFVRPRGWCAICPMGTMQNAFSRIASRKSRILIDSANCRMCMMCERTCPMNIPITRFKPDGVVTDPDCIKCYECVAVCPFNALSVGTGPGGNTDACASIQSKKV
jgi:ferredoxin-type protein NapH